MVIRRQSIASPRYVVTEFGHQALRESGHCECRLEWEGLLLRCPSCGTVYMVYRSAQRNEGLG